MTTLDILVGTGNRGKVEEIRRALKGLSLKLHFITGFPGIEQPVESGSSYEENAIIKAQSYARQTGLSTLADDSGLEVTFLNGQPGLRSARYGGESLSDAERTNLLLSKLTAVDSNERSARFVCVVAVAKSTGEVVNVAHGVCQGNIAKAPKGNEGFGYDPVFVPTGHRMTFASMPFQLKNSISHRGKALAETREFLARFFVDGLTGGLTGS